MLWKKINPIPAKTRTSNFIIARIDEKQILVSIKRWSCFIFLAGLHSKGHLLIVNRLTRLLGTLVREYIVPEVLQILVWSQNDNCMKDCDCRGGKLHLRLQIKVRKCSECENTNKLIHMCFTDTYSELLLLTDKSPTQMNLVQLYCFEIVW